MLSVVIISYLSEEKFRYVNHKVIDCFVYIIKLLNH